MAFLNVAFIISRRIPLSLASVLEFRHQSLTLKYIEIGLLKQLPLFIPMADNHNMKYTEFLRASAYLSACAR